MMLSPCQAGARLGPHVKDLWDLWEGEQTASITGALLRDMWSSIFLC